MTESKYTFERTAEHILNLKTFNAVETRAKYETLQNEGVGNPVGYTGMT